MRDWAAWLEQRANQQTTDKTDKTSPSSPPEVGFVSFVGESASLAPLPERWDDDLADAFIRVTLERVSAWHDSLCPDCRIDSPEWDRLEALVDAACAVRSRQALTDALDAYEQHARRVFEAQAERQAA